MKTSTQNYEFQVNLILILIAVFAVAFAVFFILTYINRYKRIKKVAQKVIYQKKISEILFTLLFDENATVESATEAFKNQKDKRNLFKKIAIKSINTLHRNYTGELKQKLEEFYVKSELVNYSLKKINSSNWTNIVEAIRDLSNLNYQPSYDVIAIKLKYSKKVVRKEAFIGVILLKGLNELIKLKDTQIYLDDWTQSNILYVAKRDRMTAPENVELLLTSQNETVVLLGARIIEYFQLQQYVSVLEDSIEKNQNSRITNKLSNINNQLIQKHK